MSKKIIITLDQQQILAVAEREREKKKCASITNVKAMHGEADCLIVCVWLVYLLLLLQLFIEGISFGLGCIEFLLGGFQFLLPLCLSVLHLVLQHLVLFLSPFLHVLGDTQRLLALLWLSKHTTQKILKKIKPGPMFCFCNFLSDLYTRRPW